MPQALTTQPLESQNIIRIHHSRRYWKMTTPGTEEFRAQNFVQAFPLLLTSAEQGDAEAQCMLGNLYQLGLGNVEIDEAKAMQWYYRAANQGHSVATSNLAGMVWPISREAAAALNQLAQQQGYIPEAKAS
ncbi:MAG: sel1 repeat family protein [Cyanobacteria bacterium P01_F01_bin.3]